VTGEAPLVEQGRQARVETEEAPLVEQGRQARVETEERLGFDTLAALAAQPAAMMAP
jgi:hypothetical protein